MTCCRRICVYRKTVNISNVMAGQRVGLNEVDDPIWLVGFMHYDLGSIDGGVSRRFCSRSFDRETPRVPL